MAVGIHLTIGREEMQESELRFQQVLGNLTTAQQTIERMSRALPAPEETAPGSRQSRGWWPWGQRG